MLVRIVICLLTAIAWADAARAEKLKIFIMAGQSNTVGYANAHTMPPGPAASRKGCPDRV